MARKVLRTLIQAVAITALLTGTALAQLPMPTFHLGGDKAPPTPEELEKQKATDNAYKSAIKKIPDKKPADPWGNVRSDPSTASKTK